mgnify:CR=1 FL=1
MGSVSDYEVMADAVAMLGQFGVDFEKRVVSAHRTPDLLCEYAKTAKSRGIGVIIAGAGGAAHLPGMVASMTTLPVVGVPVKSRALNGRRTGGRTLIRQGRRLWQRRRKRSVSSAAVSWG